MNAMPPTAIAAMVAIIMGLKDVEAAENWRNEKSLLISYEVMSYEFLVDWLYLPKCTEPSDDRSKINRADMGARPDARTLFKEENDSVDLFSNSGPFLTTC